MSRLDAGGPRVVSLTVHRNTKARRERKIVRRRAREMASNVPPDADGVMMLWFRHATAESITVNADWHCRDAADVTRLPEMAKNELLCRFIKGSDESA